MGPDTWLSVDQKAMYHSIVGTLRSIAISHCRAVRCL